MKVVLFCGGLGMRIREAGESVPKPMVHVGDRPILWHVMKYYGSSCRFSSQTFSRSSTVECTLAGSSTRS